jgi:hypothetical protein
MLEDQKRRVESWAKIAGMSDHQLSTELGRMEAEHAENRYNWPEASPPDFLQQLRIAARERLRNTL